MIVQKAAYVAIFRVFLVRENVCCVREKVDSFNTFKTGTPEEANDVSVCYGACVYCAYFFVVVFSLF